MNFSALLLFCYLKVSVLWKTLSTYSSVSRKAGFIFSLPADKKNFCYIKKQNIVTFCKKKNAIFYSLLFLPPEKQIIYCSGQKVAISFSPFRNRKTNSGPINRRSKSGLLAMWNCSVTVAYVSQSVHCASLEADPPRVRLFGSSVSS